MRKARPRVIHGIANASSGSRRECQNHSRFAPCGSSRSAFSFYGPTLGGFSETGANLGGLKHQSAQCPSRHRAMNRGAKKPHPTPPVRRCEKRPAASRNVTLAGQPAGLPDRLRLALRPGSFALSPLMDEHPEQVPKKMGWAEEKRLGFAPCAALTRQWARGNAGRARPTAPPAGGAGGAARAG